MKLCILFFVRLYQIFISPLQALSADTSGCRFYPSCSAYASQVLRKYGAYKGVCRGAARVLRCNPWSRGGYDPA
jgi:putative membrane protein insertion efficiency factor